MCAYNTLVQDMTGCQFVHAFLVLLAGMATHEEQVKHVEDEIKDVKAKIDERERRNPDDPQLLVLHQEVVELRKKENLLIQAAQGANPQ
jgi:cell division protein FtsL